MKRVWVLGVASVVVAFIATACGSASTDTPRPTSTAIPTPTLGATPTAQPTPTTAPTASPTDTPPPPTEVPDGPPAAVLGYSWEVSTVDEHAAKPSIAVDSRGTPHVAYMVEAMPGYVKHAVLSSGGWEISKVSTGYFYGPLDITLDQNEVPHIAWHNHDREDGAYATLVEGEWVCSRIRSQGHDGWDISVVIDSGGRPHVASVDPRQFGSRSGVEYAVLEGDSWQVEEVGSGPVAYEFGTEIVLDSLSRPHVVWYDNSDKDLKYAVKEGGNWNIATVDAEGDVGRFPSLVLDDRDNAIITYYERLSPTEGYVKLARRDGGAWDLQRIDKLDNVFLGHFGARKTSSLVLDPQDNPIVAYSDEQVIKLAWWDGSRWKIETAVEAGGTTLGQQVSLALDGSGVLHLTFADKVVKSSPGVTGLIKYARGTPR